MATKSFLAEAGLCVLAFLSPLLGQSAAAASKEQLAGVWLIEKPVFVVHTVDGKLPPFKPEASKLYQERLAARKRGDTSFDNATWCASAGIPRLMFIRSPFEIVLRPEHVAFLYQWNWWARLAYFNQVPSDPEIPGPASDTKSDSTYQLPGAMGAPLARWEGDTLIIETTSLIDATILDSAGAPHSDELKVAERLRLLSDDVLEDRIRIDDPNTFTRPWETRVTYRRQPAGTRIHEDVCLDRIRDGGPAIEESKSK